MNRYIVGGILAALVMAATSGLGPLSVQGQDDRAPRTEAPGDEALGTRPIERAGRIAQRQSQGNNDEPVSISPDAQPTDPTPTFPDGAQTFPPQESSTPSDVIPRGDVAPATTASGDISPVQPELVRPGVTSSVDDSDLDAIPALW